MDIAVYRASRNKMIPCPGCGRRVKGRNMRAHLGHKCPERGTLAEKERRAQLEEAVARRVQEEQQRQRNAALRARLDQQTRQAERLRQEEQRWEAQRWRWA